jgi:hypothetical protein
LSAIFTQEGVKLTVKGYSRAIHVPSANISSCAGQMQLGQGSLSVYTAGSQLRKNWMSRVSFAPVNGLAQLAFSFQVPKNRGRVLRKFEMLALLLFFPFQITNLCQVEYVLHCVFSK